MSEFVILSIDGGGVRAAMQIEILSRLFERFPNLKDRINLFCGTSVGAILAAGLATHSFDEVQSFATQKCFEEVFSRTWCHDAYSGDGLVAARFDNSVLHRKLKHFFGNQTTLGDVPKPFLATTFNVDPQVNDEFLPDEWRPRLYHNFANSKFTNENLASVLLQSSAAPTYFPAHEGCVDGGVMANNPCLIATLAAVNANLTTIDRVVLLSIGSGVFPMNMHDYSANLGILQWSVRSIPMFMQANSEAATLSSRFLLQNQFFRLQPRLPVFVDLCDCEFIPRLVELGQRQDLTDLSNFVEREIFHSCDDVNEIHRVAHIPQVDRRPEAIASVLVNWFWSLFRS